MLKFSGFADLTSCLGLDVHGALDIRAPHARQTTDGTGDAFRVAGCKGPHALRAAGARTP